MPPLGDLKASMAQVPSASAQLLQLRHKNHIEATKPPMYNITISCIISIIGVSSFQEQVYGYKCENRASVPQTEKGY